MKRIYITGMSGTGKTSVIEELRLRGCAAIDTDYDDWCELSVLQGENEGENEWVLREERMHELLGISSTSATSALFMSGCRSNQGKFYRFFDHKVLLSTPLEVMLERVAKRTSNPYGKSEQERAEICWNFEHIQPLLKTGVDVEIDSVAMSVSEIAEFLTELSCR